MLDSSWGLILRVLPSLPFNIPNRRLCHFPRRTGSSTARERSPLRDLFVHVSLLQISPLDDPGQFFCLPGRWCLFRHLPVVVKFLLHCRHHKGCLPPCLWPGRHVSILQPETNCFHRPCAEELWKLMTKVLLFTYVVHFACSGFLEIWAPPATY